MNLDQRVKRNRRSCSLFDMSFFKSASSHMSTDWDFVRTDASQACSTPNFAWHEHRFPVLAIGRPPHKTVRGNSAGFATREARRMIHAI